MILATGCAYREIGLENEKRLSGRGVSWCATCDGFFFKEKDIVVVGGGDSAVEEATFLTRFARTVTLVHRRDELRASKIMQHRAFDDPKMRFRWNSEVVDVLGETSVTGVRLRDTVTGEESELEVSGLFVAIGHDPRAELSAVRSPSTRTASSRSTAAPAAPPCPGCSPAATWSTTSTCRRSPRPAPAAPRPWTPSATSPRCRTRTEDPMEAAATAFPEATEEHPTPSLAGVD